MWSDNRSRVLEVNVKPLDTCNLINTDFCCCDSYDKIKSSKDLMKKVLSAEKCDWANMHSLASARIRGFSEKNA